MSYLSNITNFTGRPVTTVNKRDPGDLRSKRELEELLRPSGASRDTAKAEQEALPPLEAVTERRARGRKPQPQAAAAPSRPPENDVQSASVPEAPEAAGSFGSPPVTIKEQPESAASSALPAFTPPWGTSLQSAATRTGNTQNSAAPEAPVRPDDYAAFSNHIRNRYTQAAPPRSTINVTI